VGFGLNPGVELAPVEISLPTRENMARKNTRNVADTGEGTKCALSAGAEGNGSPAWIRTTLLTGFGYS